MFGPAVLEFLQDYFTRYHSSTDAIITILQVCSIHVFIGRNFTSIPF